ncbi:MAG TPA: DUF177 domain-containing protein [Thermoanaerobaculia bacterium]|nr:DUF177 domain-containing protein [Thermoanaerobaculia bacterium]
MSKAIDFNVIDEHGPQQLSAELVLSDQELDRPEIEGPAPVRISVEADAGDEPGEYRIEGEVETSGKLVCSRCLEPFPFANRSEFTVTYVPRSAEPESEEEELAGELLDVEYYTEREIPLREIATEQVQLSIPMKILCTEQCRGLCPVCGVDRNRTTCACKLDESDDRWDSLRQIRDQLETKETKSS